MSVHRHRTSPTIALKSGDRRPTVEHTIRDARNDPVPLQESNSVRIRIQHVEEDAPRVNAEMDIVNAEGGEVEYQWQDGDTARVGEHRVEFSVQWPEGPQTDPPVGYYQAYFDSPIGSGDAGEFDGRVDITVGHIDADSGAFGSLTVDGQTIEPGSVGEHDHTGETISPDTVNAQSATVANVPSSETDVVRKAEHDTKADAQGGAIGDETPLESVHTGNINNVLKPKNDTIQAIQDLVDDTSRDEIYIKLEPGTLYEGDTQLWVDAYDANGDTRNITIDAYGAGVHYTGTEDCAVRIRQGEYGAEEYGGEVRLLYGSWWYGPNEDGNTATIRADDIFGCHVAPVVVDGAEHGILFVNVEEWCEVSFIERKGHGGYGGDDAPDLQTPMYWARACGGASDFPDANGMQSFRDSDVRIPWCRARHGDGTGPNGGITFWQDHASFHGGRVEVRGFLPNGGSIYRVDGESRGTTAHIEMEQGDEYSTGIILNSDIPPTFINRHTAWDVENSAEYSGSGVAADYGNSSIKAVGASGYDGDESIINWTRNGVVNHGPLRVHPETDSINWNTSWLTLRDGDGNAVYGIGNYRDDFSLTVNNGGRVRAVDTDDNDVPMVASEHISIGGAGGRRHLGAFAEHPSANNGDTWYIDGSGGPSEGFYGQTGGGTVQLG